MTLVIALLLMQHMEITNPFAYIGVIIVWIAHIAYHDTLNAREMRRIVRNRGQE